MQCKPLSSISYLPKPFVFSSFSFSHHFLLLSVQEFEESGDPEHHFQELVSLAREGIAKGKVYLVRHTCNHVASFWAFLDSLLSNRIFQFHLMKFIPSEFGSAFFSCSSSLAIFIKLIMCEDID